MAVSFPQDSLLRTGRAPERPNVIGEAAEGLCEPSARAHDDGRLARCSDQRGQRIAGHELLRTAASGAA
jgi:hypothetical protein